MWFNPSPVFRQKVRISRFLEWLRQQFDRARLGLRLKALFVVGVQLVVVAPVLQHIDGHLGIRCRTHFPRRIQADQRK